MVRCRLEGPIAFKPHNNNTKHRTTVAAQYYSVTTMLLPLSDTQSASDCHRVCVTYCLVIGVGCCCLPAYYTMILAGLQCVSVVISVSQNDLLYFVDICALVLDNLRGPWYARLADITRAHLLDYVTLCTKHKYMFFYTFFNSPCIHSEAHSETLQRHSEGSTYCLG